MTVVEKVKQQLKEEIVNAVVKAGLAERSECPDVVLELPKDKSHGDFATNMAMQLARIAKKAPRQIAEEMTQQIDKKKGHIQKIEIAGPGFINFFLDNSYLTDLIPQILSEGNKFGHTNAGGGKKIQVEYVSANPTGSLHLGHARGAAVGDTLCRVLNAAGYETSPEYYINDAGKQISNMAKSLEARYFQALGLEKEVPADGYQGQDIIDFGKKLAEERGNALTLLDEDERLIFFRNFGVERLMDNIKEDLSEFRVEFDVWFSETSLYETNQIDKVLKKLKDNGHTYEQEGALWFESTKFGDDKDRVLIKSDGSYTYLTPDIAYHLNKLERGFDQLINVWGADHHGYIPRMKAAIEALGYDPSRLEVQIIQLVNLFKDGEKVKMSKRTGKAVTLRELQEMVGLDAMRYFFAMRSSDTHLDFDIDLAQSHSNENPVYYVQYAHARICSMLRQAEEKGLLETAGADFSLIQTEKEIDLMKKVGEFPGVVAEAAERLAIQRMTTYSFELASNLHSFYNAEKVLDPSQPELTKARIALMQAVKTTLKNAMDLIGVAAPEKM